MGRLCGVELTDKNYSSSWACHQCGYSRFTYAYELERSIVGIKRAPWDHPGRFYAAICECPDCFVKTWFHITKDYARKAKLKNQSDAGRL